MTLGAASWFSARVYGSRILASAKNPCYIQPKAPRLRDRGRDHRDPCRREEKQAVTLPCIMILGIGNLLFSDEGFGVRVVQRLKERYTFPENVSLVDGGVLGLNLLGVISEADHLIVVDAIRNQGEPGTLYRLEGKAIPERVRAKNSLHQVDFLEALTLCQALETPVPNTVILGVEPADIDTLSIELTPATESRIEPVMEQVLAELQRLGASFKQRTTHVSCDPLENCEHRK